MSIISFSRTCEDRHRLGTGVLYSIQTYYHGCFLARGRLTSTPVCTCCCCCCSAGYVSWCSSILVVVLILSSSSHAPPRCAAYRSRLSFLVNKDCSLGLKEVLALTNGRNRNRARSGHRPTRKNLLGVGTKNGYLPMINTHRPD